MTKKKIISIAAALEKPSAHPLAAAIVGGAEQRGLLIPEVHEFLSVTGKGVQGRVGGVDCGLGNGAMMAALGLSISASLQRKADALGSAGKNCDVFGVCK